MIAMTDSRREDEVVELFGERSSLQPSMSYDERRVLSMSSLSSANEFLSNTRLAKDDMGPQVPHTPCGIVLTSGGSVSARCKLTLIAPITPRVAAMRFVERAIVESASSQHAARKLRT